MNKWTKIILFVVIILVLMGWGKYIIPTRLEISDVQVVGVIGMDSDAERGVSFSVLYEPPKGEEEESEEKYLVSSANSFASTVRGIQHCEDKIFIGSHVKDILLGEKLAQDNLAHAMEFIGKNDEYRLDSKVYVAKEMAASEVFEEGIESGYNLSDRIENLSLTKKGYMNIRTVEVLDVLKMLLSDEKNGVIPCVQVVKNGDEQLADYKITGVEEEENRIELAGYAVISDGKLVGYLGYEESMGYDYIKNLINEESITLNTTNGVIGVSLIGSHSKIKFDFDKDALTKVKIMVDTRNSILETATGENIFNSNVKEIESMENELLKDIIEKTIYYAQSTNIDFIDIGKSLSLSHPYKWRKIKENWKNIFPAVPIEVEVNSRIQEEYGILSITNES